MNETTRGNIEEMMDNIVGIESIVDMVRWVEREVPIKSLRDLALGHATGEMRARAIGLMILSESHDPTNKDLLDIQTLIQRRIPEILGNIERELNR